MKLKTTDFFLLLLVFFLFTIIQCYSQKGIVSGELKGSGLPLPGVNIKVVGSNVGTVTDFDGFYQIECNVGDTLEISSIGFKTRKVIVTPDMFNGGKKRTKKITIKEQRKLKKIEQKREEKITTNAFRELYNKSRSKSTYLNIKTNTSHKVKSEKGYFSTYRLKNIKVDSKSVKLNTYDSDLRYNIEFNQATIYRFVTTRNLPQLQNIYTQGRPISGNLVFRGFETGELFSFGPKLEDLGLLSQRVPLFKEVFNTHSNLNFKVSSEKSKFDLDYSNDSKNSIFGIGKDKKNQFNLKYKFEGGRYSSNPEVLFRYVDQENTQPNINGFNSHVIRGSFSTPPSFNNQGFQLGNGNQRSFNPLNENNPNWLLNNNGNKFFTNSFLLGAKDKIRVSDNIRLYPALNYNQSDEDYIYNLPENTVGFPLGYSSDKKIKSKIFESDIEFNLKVDDIDFLSSYDNLEYSFITGFENSKIDYNLIETDREFNNSTINNTRKNSLDRDVFRFQNKVQYKFRGDLSGLITLRNNSTISSLQGTELFQPSIEGKVNLAEWIDYDLDIYFINKFSLSAVYSKSIGEASLLYNNTSHSSLLFSPQDSYSYIANDELFFNKGLEFERYKNYHFYFEGGFFNNRIRLYLTQSFRETRNTILPIINNGNIFQLQNIANTATQTFEANLGATIIRNRDFYYSIDANFSAYKNEVKEILNDKDRIPIAGFNNVSKNLIEGQPIGVIVGSAFQRDTNNNIVIGQDGFPVVSEIPQIIGDPNPEFNFGISNHIRWKKLSLDFTFDIQKGGDVWNGTQQALNFLGTSAESAQLRNTQGFVFEGSSASGGQNTQLVNFLSNDLPITENRWTRYGYTGVDEEAIVDGSYIHLKSIQLFYDLPINKQYDEKRIFRKVKIGIYANDIITFSKYRGASPYTNLFGSQTGDGLQFFNTPVVSEIGFKLKLKF